MAVQNNPNVNKPPPRANPPPGGVGDANAGRPAEGAQSPAKGAQPPADSAAGAGNFGGLNSPANAADVAKGWQNVGFQNQQANQGLIDTGVLSEQAGSAHEENQAVRSDASASRTEAHQEIERDLGNASAYRSSTNVETARDINFRSMSFTDVERVFARFQGQGLQSTPRPDQGQGAQGSRLAQGSAQHQALQRGLNDAANARGLPRRPGDGQAQPQQTFRAHALGFLARDTVGGRPVAYIYTRTPTGPQQQGRTPENPENPEASVHHENPTPQDTANAGRFAGASRNTRLQGERRLGADRTDEDTANEGAEEGSGEGREVARQGNGETNPVVAAFLAGRQSGGEGGEQQAQSTREVIDNAVVVFGEASPDDAARLRSEHTVNGAITAGTGYYVHRLGLGQRQGGGEGQFGSPEENMLRGAVGVRAGCENDMGELRRLSVCVNGEMIDMGSPQGQARFDAICARNPEVREAAMGLVQQRQNFTTHVTANLFNINGGEPSARA